MVINLESDTLECEVNWALESIIKNEASGDDGIPADLFQILKYDAVKVLHSIHQQIWKIQQWPQDWKRSVFIPIPKAMPKTVPTTRQLCLFWMLVRFMLKVLQARLQQVMLTMLQARPQQNRELPDGTSTTSRTRDQIANICWVMAKAREFQKNMYF